MTQNINRVCKVSQVIELLGCCIHYDSQLSIDFRNAFSQHAFSFYFNNYCIHLSKSGPYLSDNSSTLVDKKLSQQNIMGHMATLNSRMDKLVLISLISDLHNDKQRAMDRS